MLLFLHQKMFDSLSLNAKRADRDALAKRYATILALVRIAELPLRNDGPFKMRLGI
jgi:hypothetical protein